MSNISAESRNYFQKSSLAGPWDHKDSVSAKNSILKISCLCTFTEKRKTLREERRVQQNHICAAAVRYGDEFNEQELRMREEVQYSEIEYALNMSPGPPAVCFHF